MSYGMGMAIGDGYALAETHYCVGRSHNTVHIVAVLLPAK